MFLVTVPLTIAMLLASSEALQQQLHQCENGGEVSFELLTGYVENSDAKHAMREQLALFTLPQCIEACRSDERCAGITYETGACVSFATMPQKKLDFPSKRSQYPSHVTTTVARKVCLNLPKTCQERSWSFDTSQGELKVQPRQHYPAIMKTNCMELCLNENTFHCRSINFNRDTGDCYLNDVDRFSVAGRPSLMNSGNRSSLNTAIDYMESNCVMEQPKMCDFSEVDGKLLKTVDAIFENVATMEKCKEICLSSKEFQCRSFDYNETGINICRVSHHSTSSLSQLDRPYLSVPGAITYQMSSCFSIKVDCRGADMVASIHTNRLFDGKVYAKNRPNSCVNDVSGKLDFELHLDYHNLNCDVQQDLPGKFSTEIIIQHHDQIVTGQDVGLSVKCSYDLHDRSVGQGIELAVAATESEKQETLPDSIGNNGLDELSNAVEETAFVISPTVMMRITSREGGDIHAAQVGDPLSLRFHILDDKSPYEIFVRELIAMDGVDTSEIILIDNDGCPTDPAIMGPISAVDTGTLGTVKILEAPFDAFKFPTSDIVQFKALVTPCLPKCEPINCNLVGQNGSISRANSFGRRKRSARDQKVTDEVVFQEIRIEDKFKFDARRSDAKDRTKYEENINNEINFPNGHQYTVCWNTYMLILVLAVFIVLQIFIMFGCYICITGRDKLSKKEMSNSSNPYESVIADHSSTATLNSSVLPSPMQWDNSYYR
ncbi:uncharacterized protein LOC126898361 [Daktulosphaira vitifoliae]|uniref:uncharacterized protein LOC126898361 n=1 Tax=Daktulosphaira vitifoliae TaxID=58002 RepID=UPI0021A9FBE0|nr:uncharacterized protein LOC126898361 [Daktulosphaira vitifoliae]